jgi:hypothetical protein
MKMENRNIAQQKKKLSIITSMKIDEENIKHHNIDVLRS